MRTLARWAIWVALGIVALQVLERLLTPLLPLFVLAAVLVNLILYVLGTWRR